MADATSAPGPASGPEDRLLRIVSALAPGDLRGLLDELDGMLGQPPCAEAQADGVPCPGAVTACDECGRARAVLEAVRRRLGLF